MEMMDLQNQNQQILCNMLPTHVANYFIDHTTSTGVVTTTVVLKYMGLIYHDNDGSRIVCEEVVPRVVVHAYKNKTSI